MDYQKQGNGRTKTLATGLLILFTGLALYLCPCSFAEPAPNHMITKSMNHDCCEGMKDCPLKNQNTAGMKSFLDAFSHDARSVQSYNFDLMQLNIFPQLPSLLLVPSRAQIDFNPYLEFQIFKSNPPALFIKHASLLI